MSWFFARTLHFFQKYTGARPHGEYAVHIAKMTTRRIAVCWRGRRRYAGIWPSRKFRQWWIRRPFSSGRGRILYGGVQPRAMKFLRVGLGLGIVSIGFVVSLVMLLFFFLFFRPTKT